MAIVKALPRIIAGLFAAALIISAGYYVLNVAVILAIGQVAR